MAGWRAWDCRYGPAGVGRHPEDALGAVLVRVFRVRALVHLGFELGVGFLEGVGDVLEEDQAEDDVLVLGGVHAAPQGVGHPPQLGPVVGDDGVARFGLGSWRFSVFLVRLSLS